MDHSLEVQSKNYVRRPSEVFVDFYFQNAGNLDIFQTILLYSAFSLVLYAWQSETQTVNVLLELTSIILADCSLLLPSYILF